VAEDEQPSSVVGRGAEQALVVRVAADDAVQDDDVDRLDARRIHRDVVEAALGAAFHARLAEQRPRCSRNSTIRRAVRSRPRRR
jgi:hypothetical protein